MTDELIKSEEEEEKEIDVYVIDDDPTVVRRIKTLLRKESSLKIHRILSAQQWIEKILENKPPIVFLDYDMPELNWLEVLEAIKWVVDNVYMITSNSGFWDSESRDNWETEGEYDQENVIEKEWIEEKALKLGVKDFIPKDRVNVMGKRVANAISALKNKLSLERSVVEAEKMNHKLARTNLGLMNANEKLQHERVMMAELIQQSVLYPSDKCMKKFLDSFDVGIYYNPLELLSWDWYLIYHDKVNDSLIIWIFDVIWHGAEAALITQWANSIFKNLDHSKTPDRIMRDFNTELLKYFQTLKGAVHLKDLQFMTWIMLKIRLNDSSDGKMKKWETNLCSAGHPPLIVIPWDGGNVLTLGKSCEVAWMWSDEQVDYKSTEYVLRPGDKIFLYTDFVNECHKPSDTWILFWLDWIIKSLTQNRDLSVVEIQKKLMQELNDFSWGNIWDDKLLMGFELLWDWKIWEFNKYVWKNK